MDLLKEKIIKIIKLLSTTLYYLMLNISDMHLNRRVVLLLKPYLN